MQSAAEKDCYRLIQIVVLRQQPRCRLCGSQSALGHHLYKRDRMATAFLPEALVGLCDGCHKWSHAHPKYFKELAMQMLGEDRYYQLLALSHTVVPDVDFKKIRNNLKIMLDKAERCV